MAALYNEIESYPARWLENLIAAGHIAPGAVDTRSVAELRPDDVRGAVQFHTFAGIGGWSHALRLAGWPDGTPVWTGSCPCQPFSPAGRQRGFADERHLWPAWFELIRECRPHVVFGEQVAGAAGLAWLDAVFADMEGAGYACGAACLAAASVGAPHIRHRLYFVAVADAEIGGRGQRRAGVEDGDRTIESDRRREAVVVADADDAGSRGRGVGRFGSDERTDGAGGVAGGLADTDDSSIRKRVHVPERRPQQEVRHIHRGGEARGLGDPDGHRAGRDGRAGARAQGQSGRDRAVDHGTFASGASVDAWSDAEWIACTDGKSRPAQPGSFPLVHGVPTRVGRDGTVETRSRVGELRGYGNAIVPQVAAEWIRCVMDELGMVPA